MTPTNSLAESWTVGPMGRVSAPLREQVIAALRQAILDFQLKPGQRLVERELIEQLGVSRTTIREALRELTSEGLVTVVPQRGAMVSAPSLADAVDLYEVRASLESLVVQRFVERATDDEVDDLRRTVEDLAVVSDNSHDIREILQAKDRFYAVLIRGARSAALQQLLEGIQARVQVLRATSLSEAGRALEVVRELRAVVAAIAARDAELASRLCAEHVRKASVTALHSLRESEGE
ncbi:GntR family transcriptional regulator [Humibacter sp. BT305]|uniref:GntR family transcriptional regulator n=1 Tax=Cnuibacter physcomitrellae TaxID=1619308 RepID=A0A1X9LN84_9MICO|nr:GntR family transcriptional regulator [Cnuibacter physcomitrellae]ARJ06577.1 GntR family transcriptional regulator [Cnuibacter physcomitrellae]AXH34830.1 GntR family transcriptional regulator [Humibacter sp. BT305]MCS5498089.1 GntR family transcriptional regulator [Cnuibacter physcomitrellae]GGI38331.1 GntR family transcriptional regulator [Cnuibacter physcomitrellae]